MIAQPRTESGKINAICRTSRESRGNGGGLGEVWVDEDGWIVGGSWELARQHFLVLTLALPPSRWRSSSTLVISSSFCRWLILPSNQD